MSDTVKAIQTIFEKTFAQYRRERSAYLDGKLDGLEIAMEVIIEKEQQQP